MNKKQMVEQDAAKTYNEFKSFEGRKYTGMKVGGRHKWYYDKGEWNEKKVTPDRWEFSYAVPKRRAGHAPPGSGVPIGTEYHWYILGHQNVRKLDENTYSTALTGLKYKLAHKRAGKDTWSASEQAQRRHLIKILQEMIDDLSAQTPAVEGLRPRRPSKLQKRNQSRGRGRPGDVAHARAPHVAGVWLLTGGAANRQWFTIQRTAASGPTSVGKNPCRSPKTSGARRLDGSAGQRLGHHGIIGSPGPRHYHAHINAAKRLLRGRRWPPVRE